MAIDFSSFLDLASPPSANIIPLDKSKFKKTKDGGIKFDYCIGAAGENSSMTEVITKETKFNPNDYIIRTDDDMVLCAALYGSPLY